ncbi:hypothetical protein KIN20_010191 [Parelaphostrongylus tenuis]|uniref:Uncharacterized protein n=1 Tax=Parelaphostrongylus tenuis TaxID=148309 RepID=A0AAD5QNX6_PARTN|nr:hypothetical protein KIN20_010191 [Parelaphostrongylus tenuis]
MEKLVVSGEDNRTNIKLRLPLTPFPTFQFHVQRVEVILFRIDVSATNTDVECLTELEYE